MPTTSALARISSLSLVLLSLVALSTLLFSHRAAAAFVNVTIDDTFGDLLTGNQIVYEPPNVWKLGQDCPDCAAHLDPALLVNRTWHDGTFSAVSENGGGSNQILTAAVSFEGVAVYVFCVVTHSFSAPIGNSDMSFYLDGDFVGQFVQPPTGDNTYQYNVPVYVNESLPPGSHTLSILNGRQNGNQSLTLLDSIVYTRDIASPIPPSNQSTSSLTSSSPASSASTSVQPTSLMAATSTSTASHTRTIIIAVVCSIVGTLLLVALIALVIYCGRRRSRTNAEPASGVIETEAAPIDEEDPRTSGWVEGTWTGDEDSSTPASSRRTNSGKRKRKPSQTRDETPPLPAVPPMVPPKTKGPAANGVPAFRILPTQMLGSRADPNPTPLSTTSSFGNLTSTVPDTASYLLTPTSTTYLNPKSHSTSNVRSPPQPQSNTANVPYPYPRSRPNYPHQHSNLSDTFLDMGRSYEGDASPLATFTSSTHTHGAHPFATAQAIAPSAYARPNRSGSNASASGAGRGDGGTGMGGGRARSDSNQSSSSVSAAPPVASTSALSAAQRGHARGLAKKSSGSSIRSTNGEEVAKKTSASSLAEASGMGAGVQYVHARGQGSVAGVGGVGSPSTIAQTLPSTSTTPTSTTTLMPKRQPSGAGGRERSGSNAGAGAGSSTSRARANPGPRRVDPVDPAMQPPRDRDVSARDRDRHRERRQEQADMRERATPGSQSQGQGQGHDRRDPAPQEQAQEGRAQGRGARRAGIVMSEKDRQRFGFLDVPVDASDSRPPSYRESG